jgi:hypothetical protein
MGAVAKRGCCICARLGYDVDGMQAIVHHRIHGRGGWGRASDFHTIPLCQIHHEVGFKESVHYLNAEQFLEHYGFTELDLIRETQRALIRLIPASELIH